MAVSRRVLVLFEYASLNGGEHSFLAAAPYLRAAGFEVAACLLEEGPLRAKLDELSIDAQVIGRASGASQDQKREALASHFRSHAPALVHANSLSMTRLSAPVARSLGIPHLGHLRDIVNLSRQATNDLAQANRLIAVSGAVKTWYEGLGLAADTIAVVHNGVDLKIFSPGARVGPVRAELGLGERPVVVGVGQLGLRKGFDVWLAAAELVAREIPECAFLIVGEQHSRKAETDEHVRGLRQVAESGALAGRVLWLGRRGDVAQILREADLLLHAARQEPLGRVLLEALASGTPIVATDVGGTREILPPSDHATALVDVDDPVSLAAKAIALLRLLSRREETRGRYPAWAAEKFSAAASGAALARHYREVCDGAAGRSD